MNIFRCCDILSKEKGLCVGWIYVNIHSSNKKNMHTIEFACLTLFPFQKSATPTFWFFSNPQQNPDYIEKMGEHLNFQLRIVVVVAFTPIYRPTHSSSTTKHLTSTPYSVEIIWFHVCVSLSISLYANSMKCKCFVPNFSFSDVFFYYSFASFPGLYSVRFYIIKRSKEEGKQNQWNGMSHWSWHEHLRILSKRI